MSPELRGALWVMTGLVCIALPLDAAMLLWAPWLALVGGVVGALVPIAVGTGVGVLASWVDARRR